MVTSLLVMVLTAAPAKLAAPVFSGVGLTAEQLSFYTDHFAQALGTHGFSITTASEIDTLLGFERQRQLIGCDEGNSCMAELAAALGVDAIVKGSVAKLSDRVQVNVKLLAASDAKTLATYSGSASNDGQVLDELVHAATEITRQLRGEHPSKPSLLGLVPALVGVATVIPGVVLMISAQTRVSALSTGNTEVVGTNPSAFANSARMERALGAILIGVGSAAIVGGVLWLILGKTAPAQLTAALLPGGAQVSLSWELR